MPNPTAAMLVIGDEILSGRTRDANMHNLAGVLIERGIDLREARVIGDDPDAITAAVQELSAAYTHVFTSGGIGPTHDDITADNVARAFGVPIGVRADARALLEVHYAGTGQTLNEARLRMARIPEGAELIDNPISAAPGFTLRNVHALAGVPAIFEAMLQGLLPRLTGGAPVLSQSLTVMQPEGDVAGPLRELAERHPELSMGSYPFQRGATFGTRVVIRSSDPVALDAAMAELRGLFPQ